MESSIVTLDVVINSLMNTSWQVLTEHLFFEGRWDIFLRLWPSGVYGRMFKPQRPKDRGAFEAGATCRMICGDMVSLCWQTSVRAIESEKPLTPEQLAAYVSDPAKAPEAQPLSTRIEALVVQLVELPSEKIHTKFKLFTGGYYHDNKPIESIPLPECFDFKETVSHTKAVIEGYAYAGRLINKEAS